MQEAMHECIAAQRHARCDIREPMMICHHRLLALACEELARDIWGGNSGREEGGERADAGGIEEATGRGNADGEKRLGRSWGRCRSGKERGGQGGAGGEWEGSVIYVRSQAG